MKIQLNVFLTSFLFMFAMTDMASANHLHSPEDTKLIAEQMMSHFIKNEFSEGVEIAKPHLPSPEVEVGYLIEKIEQQWPNIQKRFGQTVGFELAQEQKIAGSFIRYYYLHKFSYHAIYWNITFYKPENIWLLNGVSFKDNLDILYR